MRTHMTRLFPAFLGLLVVSAVACGGGGDKGTGCDGACAPDGGGAKTDVALTPDQSLPSPDLGEGIDQTTAPDQAVAVDGPGPDLIAVKLDSIIHTDTPPDAPADRTPDVLITPDLPWGSEVTKKDLPPPPPDLPPKYDLPPALDGGLDTAKLDVAAEPDVAPVVDTTPDNTPDATDTEKKDADPTPVVSTDKPLYGRGDALTITWANGSTNVGAWLGVYKVGDDDDEYTEGYYVYTGGSSDLPGMASGVTTTISAPTEAGTYDVRLFASPNPADYQKIVTSAPFVVQ